MNSDYKTRLQEAAKNLAKLESELMQSNQKILKLIEKDKQPKFVKPVSLNKGEDKK